jgi:acyl CoA:acetate/3-ketoacid CoA transferase alpha subunit
MHPLLYSAPNFIPTANTLLAIEPLAGFIYYLIPDAFIETIKKANANDLYFRQSLIRRPCCYDDILLLIFANSSLMRLKVFSSCLLPAVVDNKD